MHTADDHLFGGEARERRCPICGPHSAHWGYCREDLTDDTGAVVATCPCHCPIPGAP